MKLIKNMKLGVKLLTLVLIGAIGMVTLGISGVYSIKKADADMDNMYNRKMKAAQLLAKENNEMRMIQIRIVKRIFDSSDTQVKNNLENSIKSYEEIWSKYLVLANMTANVKVHVPDTEAAYKNFKEGIEKTNKLVDEGKFDEAWENYKKLEKAEAQELYERLEKLEQLAKDNASVLKEETDEQSEAQLKLNTILTLVCLLILVFLSVIIIIDIKQIVKIFIIEIDKMKNGDFRLSDRKFARKDEFGIMAHSLHDMKVHLAELLRKVSESTEMMAASSEELSASADHSASSSLQVAESAQVVVKLIGGQLMVVEESNQSLDKVNAAVDNVKVQSSKVAKKTKDAAYRSIDGKKSVGVSVDTIKNAETLVNESSDIVNQLGIRSQEIGEIVDTIANIANQTNLLALNAAIEAARAGEHGKGFVVVAEEVGKLANESQHSTEKIASLIKGIQNDTQKAVSSMKSGKEAVLEGTKSIEELRSVFDEINDMVEEVSTEMTTVSDSVSTLVGEATLIATGVQAINKHSDEISENMSIVSAATEEQSATSHEIATASETLAELAQDQQVLISHFSFNK